MAATSQPQRSPFDPSRDLRIQAYPTVTPSVTVVAKMTEDSEDDLDLSGEVDLEHLLHSRDEYDDDRPIESDNRDDLQYGERSHLIELNEQLNHQDVEFNDRESHTFDCEGHLENEHTDFDGIHSTAINSPGNFDLPMNGMQRADSREQQFLAAGRRDSLSALQSKRNSAVLLNHSNVRCDELSKISDQLRRNATYKQHGPGAVTAMTVTASFVAVGTAKGLIILFDHNEEIRQVLGSNLPAGARPIVPVTALDAPKSDTSGSARGVDGLLVCGYASGEVALWDVAKGALVKLISELHFSSISTVSVLDAVSDGFASLGGSAVPGAGGEHVLALPAGWKNDSRKESKAPSSEFASFVSSAASAGLSGVSLVVITSDKDGVLYKTRFSKTLWSSTFAAESDCLLDASTGSLAGVATLGPLLQAVDVDSCQEGTVSCRYLVAHRATRMLAINVGPTQTWVVQTHPKIKIVHKWDAHAVPEGSCRELAWTWAQESLQPSKEVPPGGSEVTMPQQQRDWHPLLVRCLGEEVQTLALLTTVNVVAAKVPLVATANTAPPPTVSAFGSAFSTLLSASSAKQSNVTPEQEQRTYTSKFIPGHRRSFSGQKLLALRWVKSSELVILTVSDVIIANPQLQIVEQLSLTPSVSMDLSLFYNRALEDVNAEAEAGSARERRTQLHCDVCDHKLFAVVHESVLRIQTQSCFELAERLIGRGQWLEALALVIENVRKATAAASSASAPPALGSEADRYIVRYVELAVKHTTPGPTSPEAAVQARNHFHLVAGVCIEYCVACARMEVLFTQVYYVFRSAQQQQSFLEALEPFILSREVTTLPPGVIAEFCEYALRSQRLPSIERCVAYFEIAHLDMNFMTKFLYENRMYSGFLYVFSNGLSDFSGAFQVVFSFMTLSWDLSAGSSGNGTSSSDVADGAEIGYKLLLFLSYSFQGKVFPRGDPFIEQSMSGVALQLLDLVTCPSLRPMPAIFAVQSPAAMAKLSASVGPYPYLSKLAAVDRAGLMNVLRQGVERIQDCAAAPSEVSSGGGSTEILIGVAEVLDRLRVYCELQDNGAEGIAVHGFYEEFMPAIATCPHRLTETFLLAVVAYAARRPVSDRDGMEAHLTVLLEHQVRASGHHGSCSKLRHSLGEHNFWIASLGAARSASAAEKEDILQEQAFPTAIQHYIHHCQELRSKAQQHHTPSVFRYVNAVFSVLESVFPVADRHKHEAALCKELVTALPALGHLDLGLTKQLVHARLLAHVRGIINSTAQEPRMRYQLLDCLLSRPDDLLATRVGMLQSCFSEQDVLVYVTDLANYEPAKMLTFLRGFEAHYPLDECLQICRQKGLSEAVAFLMERTGDVLDALVMLLKDFSTRLKQVRRDVDAQLRSELAAQAAAAKANVRVAPHDAEHYVVSAILSKQDSERSHAARRLPGHAILLGIMNCVADLCARNSKADRAGMWLMAFDHLLMERQTVRAGTMSSSGEVVVVLIGLMLQALLEHMSSATTQVTPQDVIRRVTAQGNAAGIRLGEFKGMMLSMLGANAQELQLHSSMTRIIRADLAVLHGQKIAKLRKYCCRGDAGQTTLDGGESQRFPLLSTSGSTEVDTTNNNSNNKEYNGADAQAHSRRTLRAPQRATRSYRQLFAESALPADASALLLLSTGVPGGSSGGAAREARRPGSLDRSPMYKSHM